MIDAGLGRKAEAVREGRRAVETLPVTKDSINGSLLMQDLAVIYAWTGEKDLAFEQLAATARIPSSVTYGDLALHPFWDSLRGDPRFEKLVASGASRTNNSVFFQRAITRRAADFLENKIARRYSTLAMRNCFRP